MLNTSKAQLRALLARKRMLLEKQRSKLASVIHDDISQRLTALTLELALLQRRLGPGHSEAAKLSDLTTQVSELNKAVRNITNELRPKILDAFGLVAAMKYESQRKQAETGITFLFRSDPEEPAFSPQLRGEIFRLFQELVSNAVRHAGASEIGVEARFRDNRFAFDVTDNGCGFSQEIMRDPASLGLISAQEGAYWIGGELRFSTTEGRGTTVSFSIPVGTTTGGHPAEGGKDP